MNLECAGCQYSFAIEDSRLPEGIFKVRCPKCGKIVTGNRIVSPPPAHQEESESMEIPEILQEFVRSQVGKMREEIIGLVTARAAEKPAPVSREMIEIPKSPVHSGNRKALLVLDANATGLMAGIVQSLGYDVEVAGTTHEAIKKIELSEFPLIVVSATLQDDKEGSKKIIGRLNGSKADVRRRTFVVMVSPTSKTLDFNAAFLQGVNMIVHTADLTEFSSHLQEGQKYFDRIYHMFHRTLHERAEAPIA